MLLFHRHDDSWATVPGFYNAKNLQVSRLPSVFAPAAFAVFTDAQFGKELEVLKATLQDQCLHCPAQ